MINIEWKEKLALYDQIIAKVDGLERKGKTMPYTSVNGYMFALLNKACEIGIRLSKEDQRAFKEKYNATHYESYGAVMRDYVKIPERLHNDLDLMAELFHQSFSYAQSLPPK
jgi:hypothetical protein